VVDLRLQAILLF